MSVTGRDLLIVEDDAEIRLFLKTSLAADGFAVFTAVGGNEARTMAARFAVVSTFMGIKLVKCSSIVNSVPHSA